LWGCVSPLFKLIALSERDPWRARGVEPRQDAGPWIEEMCTRRPANVVIVALANKMAGMI